MNQTWGVAVTIGLPLEILEVRDGFAVIATEKPSCRLGVKILRDKSDASVR